jgi:hypothetical protein
MLKLGNHDRPRIASRYGSERVSALLTFEMTLPGVAITYYVRTGLMFEIFHFKIFLCRVKKSACWTIAR